jgi:hypothetical protein
MKGAVGFCREFGRELQAAVTALPGRDGRVVER